MTDYRIQATPEGFYIERKTPSTDWHRVREHKRSKGFCVVVDSQGQTHQFFDENKSKAAIRDLCFESSAQAQDWIYKRTGAVLTAERPKAKITALMVRDLRERTHCPLATCSKALEKFNGDTEAAANYLNRVVQ